MKNVKKWLVNNKEEILAAATVVGLSTGMLLLGYSFGTLCERVSVQNDIIKVLGNMVKKTEA